MNIHKHMKTLLVVAALVASLIIISCNSSSGSGESSTTVLATFQPDIRPIKNDSTIVIKFNESIDTSSLVLGGTLAAESNGGIWSSTIVKDDTLSITPTSSWTQGLNRTLTINAKDMAGNAMSPLTISYDIFSGAIYFVSSTAADNTGAGTAPSSAKASIMAAINAASATSSIVVNGGNYSVNSDTTGTPTNIVMKEGVSLYGGYSSDFSERDTTKTASIVTDTSTHVTGNGNLPNSVFESSTGISTATVIDGFTINASTQAGIDYSSAILNMNGGSPTIADNIINGGIGSGFSYGIYNYSNSSPDIKDNVINGGRGSQSRAIDNVSSSPLISGNTIDGGTGGMSYGISCRSSANANITGNVISGGEGTGESIGIYSWSSGPTVTRNQISGSKSASIVSSNTYGVYNDSSSTTILSRNTIHGGNGTSSSNGIYNNVASATIYNNIIYGGDSGNASYGITNGSSTSIIRNNTIDGGGGMTAYGIAMNSNPITIDNNIVFNSGGSSASYCLYEEDASGDPANVRNNDLYSCATALYLDYGTGVTCGSTASCITAIAGVNGLADTTASNNVSVNPQFVDANGADNNISTLGDNNYHFSASSPSAVIAGGLNGVDNSWGFTNDFDGKTRPASGNPWSIGAFEP